MSTYLSLLDAEVIQWTQSLCWAKPSRSMTDEDRCCVEIMTAAAREITATRQLHLDLVAYVRAIPAWLQECFALHEHDTPGAARTLLLIAANMDGQRGELFWTTLAIQVLITRQRLLETAEHLSGFLATATDRDLEVLVQRGFGMAWGRRLVSLLSDAARQRVNAAVHRIFGRGLGGS